MRDAGEHDLPAILDIYNNAVVNETSIWNDDISDLADRRAWWQARVSRGFPVYVADVDGAVAGYGTFGGFPPASRLPLHRGTFDLCRRIRTRRGIGSVLLTRLIAEARRMKKHAMVGGIAADNAASIALHVRFGFVETGANAASGHQVRPLAGPCPDAEAAGLNPLNAAFIRGSCALQRCLDQLSGAQQTGTEMKKPATALVAAGALFALSGCVADPYYGNSYYGGGRILWRLGLWLLRLQQSPLQLQQRLRLRPL